MQPLTTPGLEAFGISFEIAVILFGIPAIFLFLFADRLDRPIHRHYLEKGMKGFPPLLDELSHNDFDKWCISKFDMNPGRYNLTLHFLKGFSFILFLFLGYGTLGLFGLILAFGLQLGSIYRRIKYPRISDRAFKILCNAHTLDDHEDAITSD